MSKVFTKVRDFDAEKEPKMGKHEQAVFDAIADKGPIERLDLVKELDARKKDGKFESEQDTSGFLSFHQRALRLRGLIHIETTPSATAGKARKETLSVKVLSRLREFDGKNEPKMGKAEQAVYDLITKAGVRRPDLVAALQKQIDSGTFETAQKAAGIVSFQQGNLTKRGLLKTVTVEEPRPAEDPKAEVSEKGKGQGKKAA